MIQTYRSINSKKNKHHNKALVNQCPEDTTVEETEGKLKDLVKWSLNNIELVDPKYFKSDLTKKWVKMFGLDFPKEIPTLKKDDSLYEEFYIKKDESDYLLVCFCNHQYKTEIKNKKIGQLCSYDVNQKLKTTLIILISGLLISIVNLVYINIIPKLISQIPFKEVTSQKIFEVLLTSSLLYINSAIVPLFVNSSVIFAFFGKKLFSIENSFFSNLKVYFDFERDWYFDVGSKIALSLLISIIISTLFEFVRLRVDKR